MPGYVAAAQYNYQHKTAHKKQHSPHIWEQPIYGDKQQMAREMDTSPLLTKEETLIQQIVGTLLYYSRAVDPTMLVALG